MRISIFPFLLLFIIIVPGAYYLYVEKISYSSGAFLTSMFILIIYFIKNKKITLDKSFFIVMIFLAIIFICSFYSMISFDWFDFNRFFLSYFLISTIMISSNLFFQFSLKIDDKKLYKYVSIVFYVVLLDGFIFLIKKNIFFYGKPFLLLFPEISHFSIIFLPLLMFKVLVSKNIIYIYVINVFSLVLSIYVENLTLLVGTIMVMSIYSIKKTIIFILIPLVFIISNIGIDNMSYFTSRLSFDNPNNVSTLVFLSGWERAYLNLIDFSFLGIGFNQLGYEGQIGYYQNQIMSLGLRNLNLKDGGSLAPKLISELGVFGIFLILMYLIFFVKIMYKLKKYSYSYTHLNAFYISIFIMSSVNIFMRGSGYFSPIIFLLFGSIFYFIKLNYSDGDNFLKQKILKL